MNTLDYYAFLAGFLVLFAILGVGYDYFISRAYDIRTEAFAICDKHIHIMYDSNQFGYYKDIKYSFTLHMKCGKRQRDLIKEIEKLGTFYCSSIIFDDDMIFRPTPKLNEILLNRFNKDVGQHN